MARNLHRANLKSAQIAEVFCVKLPRVSLKLTWGAGGLRWPFLVGLFLISFSIPVLSTWQYREHFSHRKALVSATEDRIFPGSLQSISPQNYLKIADSPDLDPINGKDFLLLMWFRLKDLPAPGSRVILLSKYDLSSKERTGYAVGISRDQNLYRPAVYWKGEEGQGRWHTFLDMPLKAGVWTMLAISFRREKILGIHYAAIEPGIKTELELGGGYRYDEPFVPSSSAELFVGSPNSGPVKFTLGSLGVFSAKRFSDKLEDILRQAIERPTEAPSIFNSEEVKLWTVGGRADLSNFKHVINSSRPSNRRKEKGAGLKVPPVSED